MDKTEINRLQGLTEEINALTTEIKEQYPELYPFLDESPVTLSDHGDAEVHLKSFTDYLETLKTMKQHYVENHEVKTKDEVVNHNTGQ